MQSSRGSAKLQRQKHFELEILLQRQLVSIRLAEGLTTTLIAECRRIRRRYAKELGPEGTSFTFFFELDALVALGCYSAAWRQLLLMERSLGNRRLDTVFGQLSLDETWRALHFYAPLMYFQGRYNEARRMMELGLNPWFDGSLRRSKDIFLYVGSPDQPPKVRQRVTLFHIYQALDKPLSSWTHWHEFVKHVPIDILRNGSVSRRELRGDPSLIVNLRSRP